MIRSALTFASKGWQVFPCLPRAKEPATTHGVRDATDDFDAIRRWWAQCPDYNVAVACGEASGIFVVDVDGLDAEAELLKLEAVHGPLPASVEVITPRPGRHVYFRWPGVGTVRNSTSKLAPGIDTRGHGGYVLAPPSVHPSGAKYAWSVDTADTLADAPGWLLEMVGTAKPVNGNGHTPAPPTEWRALLVDGVDEGQRDNAATRLTGYLLRHYVDPVVARELMHIWNAARCRPPLPTADIERIVESIAGKELRRRCAR